MVLEEYIIFCILRINIEILSNRESLVLTFLYLSKVYKNRPSKTNAGAPSSFSELARLGHRLWWNLPELDIITDQLIQYDFNHFLLVPAAHDDFQQNLVDS